MNKLIATVVLCALVGGLSAQTWYVLPDAPTGASGKAYSYGSALAADSSHVYALKGNYNELYCYSRDSSFWTTMAPLPLIGCSGKKVKAYNGASLATGRGSVYAIKGHYSLEFWRFSPDSNRWVQLADMPVGVKPPYSGACIADLDSFVYLVKGNHSQEFYRYHDGGWQQLASVPLGGGKQVGTGAAMTAAQGKIYLLKGDYTLEFFRYDADSNTWRRIADLPPGPVNKTVGPGGSLAWAGSDTIYCAKANFGDEFYGYSISGDNWFALPSLPVGARDAAYGTALVGRNGQIYCIKGHGTTEFYLFSPVLGIAESPNKESPVRLTVAPNPMRGPLSIRGAPGRIRVLGVTGRLIREFGTGTGRHPLRNPPGGESPCSQVWDGTDNTGRPTGPGIYVIELQSGSHVERRTVTKL